VGADQHIDWMSDVMSALDWWREAGVDTLVEDAPRDWLTAPMPAPAAFAQAAVAAAVSSGVEGLEAAAVVSAAGEVESAGLAAVHDLTATAPVHLAAPDGTLVTTA